MKNKAKWIKRQQEIVDAARAAGRGLTAEEQAEFDALQRQIDAEPDDNGGGGEPAGGQRSVGGQDPVNTPTPPPAGTPSATGEENAQRAVAEERQRIGDILALCRQTGMDPAEYIHFALLPSLLLASTMSSTDSASVFGILGSQKVGLKHNLKPLLELESGSNDPMAYMLTIILIEAVLMGGSLSGSTLILQLLLQFGVGGAMGVGMGYATKWLIGCYRKIGAGSNREDSGQATAMISILIIGSVFLTYTATTAIDGNGYLAVYIAGIVLGNTALPHKRSITKFMDGLTWLAQIVVFLMLGLLFLGLCDNGGIDVFRSQDQRINRRLFLLVTVSVQLLGDILLIKPHFLSL